jgi:hypothetical protein
MEFGMPRSEGRERVEHFAQHFPRSLL